MIKFFHIADTHFGIENYGKIDPQTGIHSRLSDFNGSLELCIDHAIKEQIDFLLFCGDAYKTANPTPTQQKLFAKQFMRLHAVKIPIVIVVGNHDHPLSFGKAHSLDVFSYLPFDGFHVLSKPEVLKLETKNGSVQIVGIPWPTRSNLIGAEQHRFKDNYEITKYLSEKVGQIIQQLAQTLDPEIPSVLAAHLTVSNGVFSGSEKCAIFGNDPIFLPSQLAIQPFDYVALGHLHRYQNLNKGGIPVVYSGSIERIDFGERKENKGFCRVTIEDRLLSKSGASPTGDGSTSSPRARLLNGARPEPVEGCERVQNTSNKTCSYEFLELPVRPMVQIEFDVVDGKDFTQQIIDEIEKNDITDAIVKILYRLPVGSNQKIDMFAITRACSKAHFLAAVVPVFQPAVREKRAMLSVDMDFELLLEKYFETKDLDTQRKSVLLKKAQELQQLAESVTEES